MFNFFFHYHFKQFIMSPQKLAIKLMKKSISTTFWSNTLAAFIVLDCRYNVVNKTPAKTHLHFPNTIKLYQYWRKSGFIITTGSFYWLCNYVKAWDKCRMMARKWFVNISVFLTCSNSAKGQNWLILWWTNNVNFCPHVSLQD